MNRKTCIDGIELSNLYVGYLPAFTYHICGLRPTFNHRVWVRSQLTNIRTCVLDSSNNSPKKSMTNLQIHGLILGLDPWSTTCLKVLDHWMMPCSGVNLRGDFGIRPLGDTVIGHFPKLRLCMRIAGNHLTKLLGSSIF
jgi:hypothetical protein